MPPKQPKGEGDAPARQWEEAKHVQKQKEAINRVNRQPSEWGKIMANETTKKGLTSIIYKQLRKLITRKKKKIKKWTKDPKKTFLQRRHTDE